MRPGRLLRDMQRDAARPFVAPECAYPTCPETCALGRRLCADHWSLYEKRVVRLVNSEAPGTDICAMLREFGLST